MISWLLVTISYVILAIANFLTMWPICFHLGTRGSTTVRCTNLFFSHLLSSYSNGTDWSLCLVYDARFIPFDLQTSSFLLKLKLDLQKFEDCNLYAVPCLVTLIPLCKIFLAAPGLTRNFWWATLVRYFIFSDSELCILVYSLTPDTWLDSSELI